jgi:hypothetical protein
LAIPKYRLFAHKNVFKGKTVRSPSPVGDRSASLKIHRIKLDGRRPTPKDGDKELVPWRDEPKRSEDNNGVVP